MNANINYDEIPDTSAVQEDLLAALSSQHVTVHTNEEPDFDYMENGDVAFVVKNPHNDENLLIELGGEFSLFFGLWHGQYKAVEYESARVMASLQPEELQAETQVWLTGSVLNDAERKILKAADRLSAVIKCIEEDRGGNREFEAAYAQQMAALHAMHSPEAEYFIEHMLPCYEQNLDELTRGRF